MNGELFFLPQPASPAQVPPSIPYDLEIAKSTPAVQFAGAEANSQFTEIRELAGDLWLVSNASYASGVWSQVNPAIPSYALVLASVGSVQRLFAPAVSVAPLPWAPLLAIDLQGALVKTPSPFTTTAEVSLSDAPTWNASGGLMTGWLLDVTDLSSAPASKLLDLQLGGTSVFSVLKTGAVNFGGTTAQQLNGSTALPGGVILKWGQVSGVPADGTASAQLVFPAAFGTQCLQLTTAIDTGGGIVANSLSLTEYNVNTTGASLSVRGGAASTTVTVRYFAIGY